MSLDQAHVKMNLLIYSINCQVSKSKTTIIITTHYIEEARQANIVGMMRFGKLLSEDCPTKLLQEYEMTSLEDVFLHLCMQDEDKRNGRCEDEPKDLKPGHLTSIQARKMTRIWMIKFNIWNFFLKKGFVNSFTKCNIVRIPFITKLLLWWLFQIS